MTATYGAEGFRTTPLLRHRFVDDSNIRSRGVVLICKLTATEQRDLHGVEVARTCVIVSCLRVFTCSRGRESLGHPLDRFDASELWGGRNCTDTLHAGN